MGNKAVPSIKWTRERHKPFKGSSKSKSSKKGRTAKESCQKHSAKAELSKVDRKNASKVVQRHKKDVLFKQRQLNSLVKPVITILAISEKITMPILDLFAAKIIFFPHGSFIPSILDAVQVSDILLLATSPTDPSDEWSEAVQFSIRLQGSPSSVAILVAGEDLNVDPTQIISEWAAYLSDRYTGSVSERKKNVFILPSQKPQLEAFALNAERRGLSRPHNRKRNPPPYLLIESSLFDAENRSMTFNGIVRGTRSFSADDAIVLPGISYPFSKWKISSNCIDSDTFSLSSRVFERCSCHETMQEEQTLSMLPHSIGSPGFSKSVSRKDKSAGEGISDYQSAWLCEDEESFDSCGDDEMQIEHEEKHIDPSSNHNQMEDEKEIEDHFDDESSDIITVPQDILAKDFLSEGISEKQSKVIFSVKLASSTPLSNVDGILSNCLNVQIGPWKSTVKASYTTEHRSYAGGLPFSYHRLLRSIPKYQSFFVHIETPGAESGVPLDVSSCYLPVIIYGENGLPIATGDIISKSRIPIALLQRVTLVGYPYKIHQKSAVIRGMFHSAEDVEYFSPIEIVGKADNQKGYIKESLGTHGLMKVSFNRTIARQEPVFMHVYKKVE
ncbi:pre-rRNA-processing protein TSR1-like protein [Mitosporidium daphniae]|uniref:Pre-rRNA-processing protein TSR1-like protein n=1 Tax=Mitosporidium daphniae TaxID=1485682 RepID=A0A098VNA7_9MICR|nr:pre-rRNA-processing protein TSR1-like protein [Mitosporidium daphniae]KGG50415.1 pre-rRNA-processing protein TSR1-like protein [Mitosporidium daphniae]|eukprot:XP_013236842.1 pre-rRNA-processing protein TSR1-like protein [Mitosporidium daphniae]